MTKIVARKKQIIGRSTILTLVGLMENFTYQEISGRNGRRVKVDGPVHEGLTSPNCEDNGVHVINGHRFDNHSLCAHFPIGVHVSLSLFTGRPDVGFLRKLCSET